MFNHMIEKLKFEQTKTIDELKTDQAERIESLKTLRQLQTRGEELAQEANRNRRLIGHTKTVSSMSIIDSEIPSLRIRAFCAIS
jgi:hypothetical protein